MIYQTNETPSSQFVSYFFFSPQNCDCMDTENTCTSLSMFVEFLIYLLLEFFFFFVTCLWRSVEKKIAEKKVR